VPELVQQDVADRPPAVVARGLLDPRLERPAIAGLERGVLLPRGPGVRGELPEHGGVQHDETARGPSLVVEDHVGEARAPEFVHEPDARESGIECPAHDRGQVRDRATHVRQKVVRQAARARLLREAIEAVVDFQELDQPSRRRPEALLDGAGEVRFPEGRRLRGVGLERLEQAVLVGDLAAREFSRRLRGRDASRGKESSREREAGRARLPRLHRSSKSTSTGWWSETFVSMSTSIERTRFAMSSLTNTKSQQ
jgi:hypothetical protein